MIFPTASNTPRPKRLNAQIRNWAWESLHGKYGDMALQTPYVELDEKELVGLNNEQIQDIAIREIAQKAPLRITACEQIVGSATLGGAINHVIPALRSGKRTFFSVSHLTLDYETTLKNGINYYKDKIDKRLLDSDLDQKQISFLHSAKKAIFAMEIFHARYLSLCKEQKPDAYKLLLQVPMKPARNFCEAVQSLWFVFVFNRLCGNWPGIGRIDWLLGDYLKADLQSGTITIEKAREVLASFFIKGTEWITSKESIPSGDGQHYQNIVLAGIDQDGKEVTNEVTYLVLDIVEELGISDFPITVRINKSTPEKLLTKVARVIRHGGGVVAVYNEELVLSALEKYGYDKIESRNFANDGCWEVQIPGKTSFMYIPFDALAILQKVTLKGYEKIDFHSFDDLYKAYLKDMKAQVEHIFENEIIVCEKSFAQIEYQPPCSIVSIFEKGCIERAKSYYEGGTIYNVRSPHVGGVADTVNSLYAIKKIVFDEKLATIEELFQALKNDWVEADDLACAVKNLDYYGTDNDEVDDIYKDLLHEYYLECKRLDKHEGFKFFPGISTFGREIEWSNVRLATPFGKKGKEVLASNASPTPGTDTVSATAVIKSHCKADLSEMVTGAALDIKLLPTSLNGPEGLQAIKSLIKGFVSLGGYFMQLDCVSADTLKKARENPKDYKTLSVRVSGWNARFVTLGKEWQDMIIQRTEHNG